MNHKTPFFMERYADSFIEPILSVYYEKLVLHGFEHVRRVVSNAREIALEECPENVNDAVLAAYLHDIGRISDDYDGNEHAIRGAEIAKELLQKHWPEADAKRILFAIRYHADGILTEDPLIGALWDADRLDIGRAGLTIDLAFLSTNKGRKIASQILQQPHKRALAESARF